MGTQVRSHRPPDQVRSEGNEVNIYIICPVRNGTPPEVGEHVAHLEAEGHRVHFPPRDVDQNDETGERIVSEHFAAMRKADRVDVFWDSTSTGSHFDAGMAYALSTTLVNGPDINFVHAFQEDREGKSYEKVLRLHRR